MHGLFIWEEIDDNLRYCGNLRHRWRLANTERCIVQHVLVYVAKLEITLEQVSSVKWRSPEKE